MSVATCRCGRAITWVRTDRGEPVALEVVPRSAWVRLSALVASAVEVYDAHECPEGPCPT